VVVNGKKVNIPSYQVRVGDAVEVRENKRKIPVVLEAMETVARRGIPNWMEVEKDKFRGILKTVPNRAELTMPIQENLIVELYSK
jgi:small subunit ribosomal protein S4